MKFAAVLIFAVALEAANAFTAKQIREGEAIAKDCAQQLGVSPAVVARLRGGNFKDREEKTQCFVKCFFEKAGFMNESGELNKEKLSEALATDTDRSKIDSLFEKCGNIKTNNACESAFKTYECYKSKQN